MAKQAVPVFLLTPEKQESARKHQETKSELTGAIKVLEDRLIPIFSKYYVASKQYKDEDGDDIPAFGADTLEEIANIFRTELGIVTQALKSLNIEDYTVTKDDRIRLGVFEEQIATYNSLIESGTVTAEALATPLSIAKEFVTKILFHDGLLYFAQVNGEIVSGREGEVIDGLNNLIKTSPVNYKNITVKNGKTQKDSTTVRLMVDTDSGQVMFVGTEDQVLAHLRGLGEDWVMEHAFKVFDLKGTEKTLPAIFVEYNPDSAIPLAA